MVETSQTQVAGGVQSLDKVEVSRQALESLNPDDDDEEYFLALNTLADNLVSRFALSQNPDDLDEGVSRRKQVLDLASPGHFFHIPAICNVGQVLIQRFKFYGDPNDLTQAIHYFENAVESCAPDQPFYLSAVASLSRGLLNHYWRYGDVTDLDRIVEISATALATCPAESMNRDVLLNNLASALKDRFVKLGNRTDLDTALTHYQPCLDLRPPGHPARHSALGNFADAMLLKFELDGHLQDLESAASYYESALQLRSPGQDGYLLYLTSLGAVYMHFFGVQGDVNKMEMALTCYKTAMEHSTVPNLDHSRLLGNYGAALQSRYSLFGNIDDLDQAIQHLTSSSSIQPSTYPGRPNTLLSLGTALHRRYGAAGNTADLDSSIEKLASALELCEPGPHLRVTILSAYGSAISARFTLKGDSQDFSLTLSTCRDALTLCSPNQLNYSSNVANLAFTLLKCFHRHGNIEECRTIISHCDRALASTRPAEPAFVVLKTARALAFLQKFQYGREEADIDASVTALREIVSIFPKGHIEYVPAHRNLGMALEARFKLNAIPGDLDESIELYRIARSGLKRGNLDYVSVCMQLGNALRERFESHNNPGDALDEAIVLLTEVVEILSLTPGHLDYKASLINLGGGLFMRFQAQRSDDDLDAAIEHVSRALALPPIHEEFLVPFALATSLSARYNDHGDLKDLERCVELFNTAAVQMPPKHLARANLCRNYGHALVKLGHHRDRLQHLDAAIVLFRESLEHLPASHSDQPLTYMRLAEALHERAKLRLDSDGLHDAINLLRGVIDSLPEENPVLHSVYHAAAQISMSSYELSELPSFMEDGFQYYEKAARYAHVGDFMSVLAILEWAERAQNLGHSSALLAYQTSLRSLNQYLLTTASIKRRRAALLNKHWVKQTSTLATDATACAISRGELELAVELSEQGRGLLWSQLSQGRTPLDDLRSTGDTGRALASDFERVSAQLSRSAVAPSAVTASRLTTEEAARRHRQLSQELEDIVTRIRQLEGFQSFMDRPSFQSLQRAALGGPVILVNISSQRCDAIIVLHDAAPRLVPLPHTSLADLTMLSTNFYQMLKTTMHVEEEKIRERQVGATLRTLWDSLVCLIVDALVAFVPRGSRIWWCPTSKLTSLPLHASGPYRKGAQNLPAMYISSYTPTLAALIRARHQPSPPATSPPPAFVAIGQAKAASPSLSLQTVDAELALVQSLVPRSMPFTTLSGDASTGDAALAALETHAWAHFACHGHPNVDQPFDSAFALRDRAVTVLDIVRNAHTGAFAFLSACHTAAGDPDAPDEIIHLAAAMQFTGFRSVIGTMWAVDDAMVRHMVEGFYTQLFSADGGVDGGDDGWDCTQAARALNKVSRVVDKRAVALDQRVVFIHIGA